MTSAVRDALAQVGGFHVLPVRAGDGTDAPFRHLYFKRDERPKDGEEESAPSASLFVINVPADSTEGDLKRLFGVAGKIKSVVMSDSKDFSTRHCTVIFDKPTSVDRAISLPLSKWGNPVLAADHALVDKWMIEYKASRPNPQELQRQVDEFMFAYDKRIAQERREKDAQAGQPDAEGFVLVQRRGRKMTEGTENTRITAVRPEEVTVKAPAVLKDFYRFQKRDEKREELLQLQKRFEDDKKRIARFKEGRKFKPY